MIARGEIGGVSCGYRILEWLITNESGDILDPDVDRIRWDAEGLTFEATNWELLEVSAVLVAADASAAIRGLNAHHDVDDVRARMEARQRMHARTQAMIGDTDE